MEDFVTFELAKKLKEKGFREPCLGWYYPEELKERQEYFKLMYGFNPEEE